MNKISGVSLVRLIECVKYNFHGGCGCGCGFQGGCVCGFQGGCCGVSVGAVLGDYTFPSTPSLDNQSATYNTNIFGIFEGFPTMLDPG